MTDFKQAYGAMFKVQAKKMMLDYGICALIAGVTWLAVGVSTHWSMNATFIGFPMIVFILAAFIYKYLLVFRSWKISRSQTWRLLPVKSGSFVLANSLSALVNYLCFIFLALATVAVFSIPLWMQMSGQDYANMFKGIAEANRQVNLTATLLILLLLLMANFLGDVYYWLFLADSMEALADRLPFSGKSAKAVKAGIFVLLLAFFAFINNQFANALVKLMGGKHEVSLFSEVFAPASGHFSGNDFLIDLLLILALQLAYVLLLGALQWRVFNKFTEAKRS